MRMPSLWPREHGAYAQLAAPLAAALALRVPTGSAIALATGGCCAFLANEPLLVVLGHRGARALEQTGARARARLAILVTAALAAGGIGLATAPVEAIAVAGAVAVFGVVMIALAWWRAERSLPGELVAAIALPGAAAPVASASGYPFSAAVTMWAAWSVGFGCSVVAVHRVIARNKRAAALADVAIALALVGVALATAATAIIEPLALVAMPLAAASAALALRPPSARRLRAIGVALVVASSGSIAIALALQ
jgi:hypothetical protein